MQLLRIIQRIKIIKGPDKGGGNYPENTKIGDIYMSGGQEIEFHEIKIIILLN
jgi:hypothetical protein